jgi:hypothetical protein
MALPIAGATASVMLAAYVLAGCGLVGMMGSGPVKTETRPVDAFTRVDTSYGIGVSVRIGPAQPLQVQAQENLLPIIVTEVSGGTLHIRATKEFSSSQPPQVAIVVPALDAVTLSGGSQGQVDGLTSDALALDLSGGSRLTATGTVANVALDGSGGSHATLDGLSAKTATVDLSGGATARVHASDAVTGDISGGAHLTVVGDARVNVQASGGAQIDHE